MTAHTPAQYLPPARGLLVVTIDTLGAGHPTGGAGDSPPASVSISQVDVGAPAVGAGVHFHGAIIALKIDFLSIFYLMTPWMYLSQYPSKVGSFVSEGREFHHFSTAILKARHWPG